MSANIWKHRLAAPPQHHWFEAFEDSPDKALDSLLWRRFDLANLGVLDVDELLSHWVLSIGDEEGFAARVDSTLAEWIENNWGIDEFLSSETLRGIWATVGRLLCTSYVPANRRYFDLAANALRTQLLHQPSFAPLLFSPRGRDAFYTCVNAVALYQRDNALRSFWWQLAELPNGFPSRYAIAALTGIRRMRVPHGGFRFDLGRALFVVAKSFSRLVRDGVTSDQCAVDDFSFVYDRARGHFPSFDPAWAAVFDSVWREGVKRECSTAIAAFLEREWSELRRLTRGSHSSVSTHASLRSRELQLTWDPVHSPKDIESMLLHRNRGAVRAARWLLDEQRRYGLKTGNFTFLVRSLQKFAVAVRNTARNDRDLLLAQNWTTEITERDPEDPRGWHLLVNILKHRDEMAGTTWRAWRLAWALVDRFPGDAYCRNGLAEVLKSQGRLNEAEEVYRQTVEDLQHDVVARTGLAEVLKSQGRLNEAEDVYRQAIKDFPHNLVARTGLAFILAGKAARMQTVAEEFFAEAEELYRSVVDDSKTDRKSRLIAILGLGWIAEKRGRLGEAVTWYSDAMTMDRNNGYVRNRLHEVKQRIEEKSLPAALTTAGPSFENPDLLSGFETEHATPTIPWAQYLDSETELTDQPYQTAEDSIPSERVDIRQPQPKTGDESPPAVPWSVLGYRLRMARATFFRRSARWQETLSDGLRSMEPATLRAAARKLLNEVIALRPTDARTNAELFSLDLEEEAYSYDATSSERLSNLRNICTAELLQVAANAARIKSRREQYSLHDDSRREEVFRPIEILRSFDLAAKPLFHLAGSLAALAMVDSNERLQMAASSLEKLRLWVSPKAQRVREALDSKSDLDLESIAPFEAWSHSITQRFFKPCGLISDTSVNISMEQVTQVDIWLQDVTNQRHIADMEYQFARLLTPAIEETLALA